MSGDERMTWPNGPSEYEPEDPATMSSPVSSRITATICPILYVGSAPSPWPWYS